MEGTDIYRKSWWIRRVPATLSRGSPATMLYHLKPISKEPDKLLLTNL